jgi:small subunit ribosomal protein S9
MAQENTYYATGKRKNAIARTWIAPGNGEITINGRTLEDYFRVYTAKTIISQPLVLTNNQDKFDIKVKVIGGGIMGQAGAIRHGITKALIEFDAELRPTLKKAGFVRRDPREKERKKYGQKGARARFQFSKR